MLPIDYNQRFDLILVGVLTGLLKGEMWIDMD
jgi:hypothetical protein